MPDHVRPRGALGQFVDQAFRRVDQRIGGAGAHQGFKVLPRQFVGCNARVRALGAAGSCDRGAACLAQFRIAFVETADAVQAVGLAVRVKLAVFEQLRMRARDMVGLHERFDRGLPVAGIDHPLAPLVAHLVELEGREDTIHIAEKLEQRFAVGVHVDVDPAAPGIDLERGEAGALFIQRAFPVLRIEHESVFAFQVVGPAVEAADEILLLAAHAVHVVRCVDELAAAVRTDIVKGLERVGPVRTMTIDSSRML